MSDCQELLAPINPNYVKSLVDSLARYLICNNSVIDNRFALLSADNIINGILYQDMRSLLCRRSSIFFHFAMNILNHINEPIRNRSNSQELIVSIQRNESRNNENNDYRWKPDDSNDFIRERIFPIRSYRANPFSDVASFRCGIVRSINNEERQEDNEDNLGIICNRPDYRILYSERNLLQSYYESISSNNREVSNSSQTNEQNMEIQRLREYRQFRIGDRRGNISFVPQREEHININESSENIRTENQENENQSIIRRFRVIEFESRFETPNELSNNEDMDESSDSENSDENVDENEGTEENLDNMSFSDEIRIGRIIHRIHRNGDRIPSNYSQLPNYTPTRFPDDIVFSDVFLGSLESEVYPNKTKSFYYEKVTEFLKTFDDITMSECSICYVNTIQCILVRTKIFNTSELYKLFYFHTVCPECADLCFVNNKDPERQECIGYIPLMLLDDFVFDQSPSYIKSTINNLFQIPFEEAKVIMSKIQF